MRRLHLFEVLDQSWCPQPVRDGATDCLEAITSTRDIYRPVRAEFVAAIRECGAGRVVDLCSGGGGPWLSRNWIELLHSGGGLRVVLTDKFPSVAIQARLREYPGVKAVASPVDATDVPAEWTGFRTMFSSFHHFPDGAAIQVLEDAIRRGEGFATAEATSRSVRAVVTIFALPLLVWWLTLRMRPFRWSRLILTCLVPVIPLVILWDGVVSCLRTRTPEELLALTAAFSGYRWKAGYARGHGAWLAPVYLIGVPKEAMGPGAQAKPRNQTAEQS